MSRDVVIVAHEVHERGGMERALAELLKQGGDRYRFTVVARDLAPNLRDAVRWERIRVPGRPFPARYALFWALAGFRLRRFRKAVIHTQGAVIPNRADVSSIHACHRAMENAGVHRGYGSLLKRINARVSRSMALAAERWCYTPARLGVAAAVSDGVAAEMRQLFPGFDVVVTPNGVDHERFHADLDERERLRAAESVGPEQIVVLFVGGEWKLKGLDLAVEALARTRETGVDALLWVIGSGDSRWLEAVAERSGVSELVRPLGRREDVERFYQAADVFILPSAYETFSLVAHEAAASGLPVLATRVSGVAELIDAGGAVETRRDARAIADALCRLAGSAESRAEIGDAGRLFVSQLTWARSADSVFEVYESAFAARSL